MTKSLKEKALNDYSSIKLNGNKNSYVFKYEDVQEAVNDFEFIIDYNYVFDENSSYEESANREYFEICEKYNLDPFEEYSNSEIIIAIFGNWEVK